MIAKPIIDIQIGICEYERAFKHVVQLERLGYTYKGENSGLRQYHFTKGNLVRFNIYLLEQCGATWAKRTAFREYLKNDRESADRYAELKQVLASRHPDDIRAYQDGKLEFVEAIVRAAQRQGFI